MMKRVAAVVLTAAALLLVGGAVLPRKADVEPPPPMMDRLQQRVALVPGDWTAWAALGMSYVERGRTNPAFYPKAEAALNKSQRLRPNDVALAGLGALANSRHEFALAVDLARQAISQNAYSAAAYGVLVDALTQLGEDATDAVQKMLDLDPGLPALSRAAYDLEQRGLVDEARALWVRALRDAYGANAIFVHQQLGDLAWHAGDLATAETEYVAAQYKHGLARVRLEQGDVPAALALYAAAQPTVSLLAEYSTVLAEHGEASAAQQQLKIADAALALLAANGGVDNLAAAEVAAAKGDFGGAVALCEKEWLRRKHTDVADLLGWSLHLAGRDPEALTFAKLATAKGIQHRGYSAHLRAIEEALS